MISGVRLLVRGSGSHEDGCGTLEDQPVGVVDPERAADGVKLARRARSRDPAEDDRALESYGRRPNGAEYEGVLERNPLSGCDVATDHEANPVR